MDYRSVLLLFLWACGFTAPITAMSTESFGPMSLDFPAQWKREPRPDGTVTYVAGEGTPERSEVQLFSVAVPEGDQRVIHNALWGEVLKLVTSPSRLDAGESGRFQWSQMTGLDANAGRQFWYRLYTTREGASCLGLVIVAPSEQSFRNQIASVDAVLAKAQLGNSAAVPALDDTRIVESWMHVEVRFGSMTSGALTDHVLFFANGIAVRTGVIDGPIECYALLPGPERQPLPSNYGRWREDASARIMDVTWQEGAAWRLVRESGHLSLDGRRLLHMRPIDGARLDGVYQYRPVGDDASLLILGADGTFEARNLKENMLCAGGGPKLLSGTGSYEIRKWTLILRFDAGITHLIPIKIAETEDLRAVRGFVVKSYSFERTR